VELTAQISGAADPRLAISRLKKRIATITQRREVSSRSTSRFLTFTPFGPVLAVRPYCHNDDYWQVYFDTKHGDS